MSFGMIMQNQKFHCLKTGESYKDIAANVEIRLDPSSNE